LGSNDPFRPFAAGQMIAALPGSRRILMFGSNFLRSLVRDIVAAADDLEIVGELDDTPGAESRLLAEAERTKPDFVIVALADPGAAEMHLQLLERRPLMKVLAVAGPEHDAHLWELQPHLEMLGQISPERLLSAIRAPDWRHAGVS
jgi:DNA-binding NarL/FixJ family response regulator